MKNRRARNARGLLDVANSAWACCECVWWHVGEGVSGSVLVVGYSISV